MEQEDITYELGNGSFARLDTVGYLTIYNDDSIIVLNPRQFEALKDALTPVDGEADAN